ncbi:MAG TPA: DoxX family membrane protein [Acidobacteriaceae bacterium]|jgi:thiosulfate dehydrogenase [quinone] large subunit|nr:DoxX family membrane protein [Acidobacteriaceae bacterium]
MEEQVAPRDGRLAYLLFRALLGINICLHGMTRLAAGDSKFAGTIVAQFSQTILPHGLVAVFGLGLPWAEAVIGFLLTLGLLTRAALTAGFLVMLLLMFGTCLAQNWQVAGLQLIYGMAYGALLFLLPYNTWSIDAVFGWSGGER